MHYNYFDDRYYKVFVVGVVFIGNCRSVCGYYLQVLTSFDRILFFISYFCYVLFVDMFSKILIYFSVVFAKIK